MDLLTFRLLGAAAVTVALGGCATTLPYVSNDSKLVVSVAESDFHRITYVRADEDEGELVVYGKVDHRHGYCVRDEHVDVAIKDRQGQDLLAESLPLKRSTSPKQHGWYGASFRTKLKAVPAGSSRLMLAVHDSGCTAVDGTFDCGENVATTTAPAPERSDGR